jgi:3D (Asp-Asp-Asp) domain-containing protein
LIVLKKLLIICILSLSAFAQTNNVKKTVDVRSTATRSFVATAYCLTGRTAMGHGVRRGVVAGDPRVLKLGTRILMIAGGWTGHYLVSDTGGGIRGNRIDLWTPSCSEARRFGRRTVQVQLL